MSVIRVLPENVSNKIAAGEVVERPASIVKELVENAIDAGAARITVQVERGGLSLIRVSDNGTGMSRDDALLCLERHATSKLVDESSLLSISTLGFRGEALPSIAAVSNFSLVTREAASEAGTEIIVSGGKIRDVRETGAPVGTMVEVRQLFFNTPARRKFVKSVETELAHIADMTTAFALSRHDIHFQLSHNGKTVRNWPPAANPADRVAEALGRDARDNLHAIAFSDDRVAISGWTSAPYVTRRSSQKVYLFVNGRMVRDRGLLFALFEGYRGRLVKGFFPVSVIFLKVPFDRVDVNVHPAKSEVRFADQRRIYESLKAAVARIWETETPPPWENRPFISTGRQENLLSGISENPASYSAYGPARRLPADAARPAPGPVPAQQPVRNFSFSGLLPVGQFHNTYLVCESEQEIVLIDQHAAHERVLFEKLKQRAADRKPVSQGLLVPETVELTYREAAAIEPLLPALEQAGLLLEPFGQNTFIVKAVPELIVDADAARLVQELAGKMADIGLTPEMDATADEFLSVMACHGAIRANRRLNEQEMRALLEQLDGCDNPWHCPHGRPTVVRWPLREIEKLFKRIV